ncbi:MAG: hypothetical protein BWY68_00543 [bacterium ADurb.Bin400]|nr:MAG: hypothetical protein BWY68_00543 [bacterium ADurb.Bin400]
MSFLDKAFDLYDTLIMKFSPGYQALISLSLLVVFLFLIYRFIKSPKGIILIIILILLPGTWPALKYVGSFLLTMIKFFITRIIFAL